MLFLFFFLDYVISAILLAIFSLSLLFYGFYLQYDNVHIALVIFLNTSSWVYSILFVSGHEVSCSASCSVCSNLIHLSIWTSWTTFEFLFSILLHWINTRLLFLILFYVLNSHQFDNFVIIFLECSYLIFFMATYFYHHVVCVCVLYKRLSVYGFVY